MFHPRHQTWDQIYQEMETMHHVTSWGLAIQIDKMEMEKEKTILELCYENAWDYMLEYLQRHPIPPHRVTSSCKPAVTHVFFLIVLLL